MNETQAAEFLGEALAEEDGRTWFAISEEARGRYRELGRRYFKKLLSYAAREGIERSQMKEADVEAAYAEFATEENRHAAWQTLT